MRQRFRRPARTIILTVLLAVTHALPTAANGKATHGIAMHGQPALPAGFAHFPHVRPDAPKGGRLNLGVDGTFDSLNPLIVKGVSVGNVRGLVYESLMARAPDEPFTLYGLLAERVVMPEDRSSIEFHLNKAARFSDGHPVTAEDVVFSQALLRKSGRPFMRSHYKKIATAEALDAHTVRFTFNAQGDREIPLIIALMPILPKHRINPDTFEETTLEPPIGSGPYVIARADAPRQVIFKRNRAYWGRNLNVRRGRHNFDEIRLDYYRDASALFEAFKAGQVDFRLEKDPVRWAEGYRFPAVQSGDVVVRSQATNQPAGMTGFALNTRRPVFADARVRRALIHLFDFEWINRALFNGLYKRSHSFFSRSQLAAFDKPADARELKLLERFSDNVKPALLDGTFRLPASNGSGRNRTRLREAIKMLREAGWRLDGQTMLNAKTGKPLTFEFLALSRAQENLMLAYARTLSQLGIKTDIRRVDNAQYWSRLRTFDFDVIQWNWSASLSPGNEQINRWGSNAADIEGSLNFPGVKSAGIDAMIDEMLAATGREDFEAAVRAFDRLLMSGDYVVPLFHREKMWFAHWARLQTPDVEPLSGLDVMSWWDADTAK